ncbi:hypothetical protein GXW82_00855 [Streptacidiphilus sp. 4-A2]|nr:hypothetical protein [Streptacidiphilus sp. 4-A2]
MKAEATDAEAGKTARHTVAVAVHLAHGEVSPPARENSAEVASTIADSSAALAAKVGALPPEPVGAAAAAAGPQPPFAAGPTPCSRQRSAQRSCSPR